MDTELPGATSKYIHQVPWSARAGRAGRAWLQGDPETRVAIRAGGQWEDGTETDRRSDGETQ